MHKGLILTAQILTSLTAAQLWAETPPETKRSDLISTYYWENDGSFFKPNHRTDRHYTNGAKITFTHHPHWPWLQNLTDLPGRPDGRIETALGYSIGQNIYTPDHVDEPARRRPKDRIYAGYLYTGLYHQRANDHLFDHLELNVGIIGPSARGEQAQQDVHNLFNLVEPLGWEAQLDDEFAIDLIYLRKWRQNLRQPDDKTQAQLIPEMGFMLGSVNRNFSFGATYRFGANLPDDFGPGRIIAPVAATGNKTNHRKISCYGFVRAAGKLVEHNRFLTGLSAEPFMGEFQAGLTLSCQRLALTYSQTFWTREFAQQSGKDAIGALVLSLIHRY